MDTPKSWTTTAKTLHWLIAFLLLAIWASVELHELVPRGNPWRDYWIVAHFTLGITALAVMVFRLIWRAGHKPPAPLGNRLQQRLATAVHHLLYLLVLAMPVTGLLMRQLDGKTTPLPGTLSIPVWLPANTALAERLEDLHKGWLWNILLALIALHVAGALWHHWMDRDNTLKRMLPGRRAG